jgi:4-hydroxy-3-methylbut-2-enyl diphosphate reductase
LVIGSRNSSNTIRLHEIAVEQGLPSYVVGDGSDLDMRWFDGAKAVGITAGASAPEAQVQDVVETLRRHKSIEVTTLPGVVETIQFRLPVKLAKAS